MIHTEKKLPRRVAVVAAFLALYTGHTQAAPVDNLHALSNVVSDKELAQDRGAGTQYYNNATSELNGTAASSTNINALTGMNSIGAGAFANAGISNVIENSGNSVVIQNDFIANVTIATAR